MLLNILKTELNIGFERVADMMKGFKVYSTMPKGWRVLRGATTAPNGYVVISNKKSRFCPEYRNGLLKL